MSKKTFAGQQPVRYFAPGVPYQKPRIPRHEKLRQQQVLKSTAGRPNLEVIESFHKNRKIFTAPDGTTSVVYDNTVYTQRYRRQYSGTRTPGFRSLKKTALPFRPYSLVVDQRTPVSIVQFTGHDFGSGWGTWTTTGDQGSSFVNPLGFSHQVSAEEQCIRSVYEKLKPIKANLALVMAERQQTVNLIGSTAHRLVHASVALGRLRFKDLYRALGVSYNERFAKNVVDFSTTKITRLNVSGREIVRSALLKRGIRLREYRQHTVARLPEPIRADILLSRYWLELQYGWKPLLSDVKDAVDLLASHYESNRVQYIEASGTANSFDTYDGVGDFDLALPKCWRGHHRTKCKYAVGLLPVDSAKSALRATGITDPFLVIWEKIPYSFLIDWFLPVGAYLEALSTNSDFRFTTVNRTRFSRLNWVVSGSYEKTWWQYGKYNTTAVINGSGSTVRYDRDVITMPGFPLTFKDPVSIEHAMNAIALLSQTFSRHQSVPLSSTRRVRR